MKATPATLFYALLGGGCTTLHDLAGFWEGRGSSSPAATAGESRSNADRTAGERDGRPDRERGSNALGSSPLSPEPETAPAVMREDPPGAGT